MNLSSFKYTVGEFKKSKGVHWTALELKWIICFDYVCLWNHLVFELGSLMFWKLPAEETK